MSEDEKISNLEADMHSINERLGILEDKLQKGITNRKGFWELAAPYFSGIAVLVVGYLLTGSVNIALQRQQLQLSNAKEIKELLITLAKSNTDSKEVESAALALAAFGSPAIAPLVNILQTAGDIRAPAVANALQAIGLGEPNQVCDYMNRILKNRTGFYTWTTHQQAINLLGYLNCQNSIKTLSKYSDLISSISTEEDLIKRYAIVVRDDPNLTLKSINNIKQDLNHTLEILTREKKGD